jgi:Xaa-Pro aminopeptidase
VPFVPRFRNLMLPFYGKYYAHEAFHGLGLEVEEAPFLHDTILKENMVMSIESGIYIPDKMGIRLEDVVVVTDAGPKVLTHAPREIFLS